MRLSIPMRMMLALVGPLFISACSGSVIPSEPSAAVLDRLERQLTQQPCVGNLNQWERNYGFFSAPVLNGIFGQGVRWYYRGKVFVDLRQAGFEEFRAGRYVHRVPPHFGIADDRPYKLVGGEYDVKVDRLRLHWCGANI